MGCRLGGDPNSIVVASPKVAECVLQCRLASYRIHSKLTVEKLVDLAVFRLFRARFLFNFNLYCTETILLLTEMVVQY